MEHAGPVIGVDPHLDTFDLVAVDALDRMLMTKHCENTPAGWAQAAAVAERFGITTVGIEGASGYGAALARTLVRTGLRVMDVPTRVTASGRRTQASGKNDQIDARIVARAVLANRANQWADTPELETLRVLTHRRESLVKAQTRDINALRALLVELDPPKAAQLRRLRSTRAFNQLIDLEPQPESAAEIVAQLIRDLAADCCRRLSQIRRLERQMRIHLPPIGHKLIDEIVGCGVITAAIVLGELAGTDGFTTEAKYAKWSGTAPLDASSGRQQHHRLNRGGNRQTNRAIHTIVLTQLAHGGQAADYIKRRQQQGLTRRSAIRAAKRYVARRIWRTIHQHQLT
ncbi:MAG: IS110 family transposase [Acidobacteria bacterium]|nr:IS110 family transposase [Acidobacteriota bacterium]